MQMKELYADAVISNLQSFLWERYTLKKHVLCLLFLMILTKVFPSIYTLFNFSSC